MELQPEDVSFLSFSFGLQKYEKRFDKPKKKMFFFIFQALKQKIF